MNRCPITYEGCGRETYSPKGLRKLSSTLKNLVPFPYTADEQRREAVARAAEMSIQGVQSKLSVVLDSGKGVFKMTDIGGKYIVKPQNISFEELPENEDLTLRLARIAGIEVPFHGLMYSKDGSLSFFVKRFDRIGRKSKLHVEDFAQLAGRNRETRYDYSMERLVRILDHCTFPLVERLKLFRLTIFNYLAGNEDMHLKNFSLIRRDQLVEMSPAYDLVNSTIVLRNPVEIALPLNGKRNGLTRQDLLKYFGKARLDLTKKSINKVRSDFEKAVPEWKRLVTMSFLSRSMQKNYVETLNERREVVGI